MQPKLFEASSLSDQPTVYLSDENSRHPHFAGVYTIIAIIAGTLAIPYHETPILPGRLGAALAPALVALSLLLNCALLLSHRQVRKAHELRWLARGYAFLAIGTITWLPIGYGADLAISWIKSLCVLGFGSCLVIYMVDPKWRSTRRAWLYRGASAAIVVSTLIVTAITHSGWPLALLELLTLSGALMLLLSINPRHVALEAWSAALVAIMILAHVIDPLTISPGALPWATHWTAVLLVSLMLNLVSSRHSHR